MAAEREEPLEPGSITIILPPGVPGPENFPDWRRERRERLKKEAPERELSLEAFALGLEGPKPDNTHSLWEKVVQTTRAAEVGRITGVTQEVLNQLTINALVAQMDFLERLKKAILPNK